MTEYSTEYRMGWVGQGDVPLPAQSRAAMAREDAEAQREAEREAARAQDRAEAVGAGGPGVRPGAAWPR